MAREHGIETQARASFRPHRKDFAVSGTEARGKIGAITPTCVECKVSDAVHGDTLPNAFNLLQHMGIVADHEVGAASVTAAAKSRC